MSAELSAAIGSFIGVLAGIVSMAASMLAVAEYWTAKKISRRDLPSERHQPPLHMLYAIYWLLWAGLAKVIAL